MADSFELDETRTEDEWLDENQNQMRDPWEELTVDHDKDGEMDYAPRVKLTVAEYLLPTSGSIHRKIDREGHLIKEGGVKPDVEVDAPLIEGWRIQEQRRIRPQLKKHVDETYAANRELYNALALNDHKRTDLYPGFDSLMQGLETSLPPDDVRRWLRYEVRRRVQDDRGAAFPLGDFVEDVQLQKAIELALEGLGKKPAEVDDFSLVFDLPKGTVRTPTRASPCPTTAARWRSRSARPSTRSSGGRRQAGIPSTAPPASGSSSLPTA